MSRNPIPTVEDSVRAAWSVFRKSPEIFITIAFGFFGASFVFDWVPILGPLASLLLWSLGPAAFFLAADEAHRTGTATFGCLKALPELFPQLLALFVVKAIVITIGFAFLVVPGVYLAVLFLFAELFVVIERKPFLDALRASRELVQPHWFGVFGLAIVVGMIAFSGVLLVLLGLLLSVPFSAITIYCAFRLARDRAQVVEG